MITWSASLRESQLTRLPPARPPLRQHVPCLDVIVPMSSPIFAVPRTGMVVLPQFDELIEHAAAQLLTRPMATTRRATSSSSTSRRSSPEVPEKVGFQFQENESSRPSFGRVPSRFPRARFASCSARVPADQNLHSTNVPSEHPARPALRSRARRRVSPELADFPWLPLAHPQPDSSSPIWEPYQPAGGWDEEPSVRARRRRRHLPHPAASRVLGRFPCRRAAPWPNHAAVSASTRRGDNHTSSAGAGTWTSAGAMIGQPKEVPRLLIVAVVAVERCRVLQDVRLETAAHDLGGRLRRGPAPASASRRTAPAPVHGDRADRRPLRRVVGRSRTGCARRTLSIISPAFGDGSTMPSHVSSRWPG